MTDNSLLPGHVDVEDAARAEKATAPHDNEARIPHGTAPAWQALSFDADEFIQYVKDHDLSDAEAYEFLATVWVYMVTWVDLGFGIHPTQQSEAKPQEAARRNNPALDHESALVLTCREAFNNNIHDKTVQRPKGRRAGRKDS